MADPVKLKADRVEQARDGDQARPPPQLERARGLLVEPESPPSKAPDDDGSPTTAKSGNRVIGMIRRHRRLLLLVVLPVIAVVAGVTIYLMTGRYVTTDDAYVGAQKVLVTPDISGKIARIDVREGQHVNVGDTLFEIDPVPFQLAARQAQSKLTQVKVDFDNAKTNDAALSKLIDLAQKTVDLRQRDVDRKTELINRGAGTQVDLDSSINSLVTAQTQFDQSNQQRAQIRNGLLGDPDLTLQKYPPYVEAQAALDQANRDLNHTTLRAAISGIATQVDQIQLGRFVQAGSAVFSIFDDQNPWVDANPKETDFTYLRAGDKVEMEVDAFPNHTFRGTVSSLSPGTGAQFSILPPQNATGNFIKVVQRVPVRINFDPNDPAVKNLKAGMSVYTWIDTGRQRTLGSLIGWSKAKRVGPPAPAGSG